MIHHTNKKCTGCSKEKSLKHFAKNGTTRDGYNSKCKKCMHEYYEEYKKRNTPKCGYYDANESRKLYGVNAYNKWEDRGGFESVSIRQLFK